MTFASLKESVEALKPLIRDQISFYYPKLQHGYMTNARMEVHSTSGWFSSVSCRGSMFCCGTEEIGSWNIDPKWSIQAMAAFANILVNGIIPQSCVITTLGGHQKRIMEALQTSGWKEVYHFTNLSHGQSPVWILCHTKQHRVNPLDIKELGVNIVS